MKLYTDAVEYVTANRGKMTGILVGLLFAIGCLTLGFWKTLFVAICVGVGAWIGGRKDAHKQFVGLLDRVLPKLLR